MLNLTDMLGIKVTSEPWNGPAALPHFLFNNYTFNKVSLDGVACMLAEPTVETPTIQEVLKHFTKIHNEINLPVVLKLNGISNERKKAMIAARIPFVSAEQIYLPFMGVYLQDRLYIEPKSREKLMPSSQLLLFSYLYQKDTKMHTNKMAEKIGVSAMQVTRAIRQLRRLNLIEVSKEGVQLIITGKANHRDLYDLASDYLIDPVREVLYVPKSNQTALLPHAGFTAIADMSMLADSSVPTYAFYSKTDRLNGEYGLSNKETQVRVEIWKYPPTQLSIQNGIADPLSVIISLKEEWGDERVEQATDSILNELWK